jgi:exopolysaccharide biosynthesis polyprenyl glycosylphosphotransferase
MLGKKAKIISLTQFLADEMVTLVSFLFAYWIRAQIFTPILDRHIYPLSRYALLLIAIIPGWAIIFWIFGLYRSNRIISLKRELWEITRAVFASAAFLALIIFLTRTSFNYSRILIGIFIFTNWAALSLLRLFIRSAVKRSRSRGYNTCRVIVVGIDQQAANFETLLEGHPHLGIEIVGYINPDSNEGTSVASERVLGSVDDLPRIIQKLVVDEVVFVVSPHHLSVLEDIFLICEEQGIRTRMVMEYLPRQIAKVYVEMLEGIPVITFSTAPVDVTALFIKRISDVILSLIFLVIAVPFMLLIALAVKLSSPGPVFFRQTRCGLNGRKFILYKFRSMYSEAEEKKDELAHLNIMEGPVFKIKDDPRVTPVGKILRSLSLDELPQLFNILIGDMSFVGPRPAIPEEVSQYERWQRRRLSMEPGLTCLWQTSGRNNLDFQTWMKMDLEYIDNWSLWMDIKIILKTIPSVLARRGAM